MVDEGEPLASVPAANDARRVMLALPFLDAVHDSVHADHRRGRTARRPGCRAPGNRFESAEGRTAGSRVFARSRQGYEQGCDEERQRRNGETEASGAGGSEHREKRNRHDERQRISDRDGLVEQEMEHRIGDKRNQQQTERQRRAQGRPDEADRGQDQYRHAKGVRSPGPHERIQQGVDGNPGLPVRPHHHHAREIFAGLCAERRQIARQPAACDEERDTPRESAGDDRANGFHPVAESDPGAWPGQRRDE